ncbi:S-layer homology domain-containing protein [uncultured Flavonifractor sp.]|uniref:S-layer homology domain-containing protein n=1 Tax=uncultured Flavonifractor sp. TaxID=1193534 RepID=UPI0025F0F4B8|nr:S-layer homology domain-containing protein [uncultured Flavonifractor sp.]
MKKLYQRILSMALSVSMLLSMAVTVGAVDSGTSPIVNSAGHWTDDGNYDAGLYASEPGNWVINDAADLAALAKKVNEGSDFSGYTVTLGQNIDLSDHNWVPIGTSDYPFAGNFDGAGHVIQNLSITGELPRDLGLFGRTKNAALSSLSVQGQIEGTATDSSGKATFYAGGICAYFSGSSVTDLTSDVDINITADFTANRSELNIGGMFGELILNSGTARNLRNDGDITVSGSSSATNSYAYVGGLAHDVNNGLTVDACNTGDITVSGSLRYVYAGGFVQDGGGQTMVNCLNSGDISVATTHTSGKARAYGFNEAMTNVSARYYNCVNTGSITVSAATVEKAALAKEAGSPSAGNGSSARIVNCFALTGTADSLFLTDKGNYMTDIPNMAAFLDENGAVQKPLFDSMNRYDALEDKSAVAVLNAWVEENPDYDATLWEVDAAGLPVLNIVQPEAPSGAHSINLGTMENGTLWVQVEKAQMQMAVHTASNGLSNTADAGDTVKVTVLPNTNYLLKEDSLKCNDTVLTPDENGVYTFVMPDEDVTLTAEFWYAAHSVTLTPPEAAAGTASVDQTMRAVGLPVTLTIEPERGYIANPRVTYTDENDQIHEVELVKDESQKAFSDPEVYTFTMPAYDVTVTTGLEKIEGYDDIFLDAEVNAESTKTLAEGYYSVEYSIWNASYAPGDRYSMANDAKINPLYMYVNAQGEATYYMTLQWIYLQNLRGHLLELWSIPATYNPFPSFATVKSANQYHNSYNDSAKSDEEKASVVQYLREQGISADEDAAGIYGWPMGNYPRVYKFTRTYEDKQNEYFVNEIEDGFYIYVHVDAMEGFNQQAYVELNWNTIQKLDQSEFPDFSTDTSGMNAAIQGDAYRQPVESNDPPTTTDVPGLELPEGVTASISKLTDGDEYDAAVNAVGAEGLNAVLKAEVTGDTQEGLKLYVEVGQGENDWTTAEGLKLYQVDGTTVKLLASDISYPTPTAPIIMSAPVDGSGIYVITSAVVENAEKPQYSVLTAEPENGSVSVSADKAAEGTKITVTPQPDRNYQVKSVKYNGTEIQAGEDGIYTFTMPAANVTVEVSFEAVANPTYSVTISPDIQNGSVTASSVEAHQGDTVTLTVTPSSGYVVETVQYNGQTIAPQNGTYAFVMPAENVIITATFKKDGGTNPGGNPGGETETRYYTVEINLWHATLNQASMGNVAFDNNRLAIYDEKTGVLQIASNPVSVSGYYSAIRGMKYQNDDGEFVPVSVLETGICTPNGKWEGITTPFDYLALFEITLPDSITGKGVEYIDLKIDVPYTPMDSVAVGADGYLDARLKIDWSTLQSTEDSELEPDDDPATGTSSITGEEIVDIDLIDKDTGIRLTTDSERLSDTATLSVEKLTSGSDYDTAVKAMSGIKDSWSLYNITALVDGAVTAPEGSVTISIPCTADGLTVYRINAGGTKTVLKGEVKDGYYVLNTSSLGLFAIVGALGEARELPFTDVETGSWYYDGVKYAVEKGLFTGTSATTFAPNMELTRSMLVTVLYRLAGSPEVSQSENFSDVQADSWYEDAVTWAAANGVVAGYGGGVFGPDDDITREQLAVILYRYAQLTEQNVDTETDLTAYSDAGEVSDFAREAMVWAVENGLISGTSATTLSPKGTATRAQVAVILMRYLEQLNK